eukprot:1157166-Pelagomonas_calceolata.AAC.6
MHAKFKLVALSDCKIGQKVSGKESSLASTPTTHTAFPDLPSLAHIQVTGMEGTGPCDLHAAFK